MPAAVLRVDRPIMHPVPAATGQFIVWYPGQDLVVFARTMRGVRLVRRLGHDNAGALGVQLHDGALTCVFEQGQGAPLPAELSALPSRSWSRTVSFPVPSPAAG